MTATRICELGEGDRFAIPGLNMKAGTILRQSGGGTTVRYDGRRQFNGHAHQDEASTFSFTAPNVPVQISGGTEVVRI